MIEPFVWLKGLFISSLGMGLFWLGSGFQINQSLNISFADLLRPLPRDSQPGLAYRGSLQLQVQGKYLYWTRTSVLSREHYAFSVVNPQTQQTTVFAEFDYQLSEFGDKQFFRKPLRIPGAGALSDSRIQCEIRAGRYTPETRVTILDYTRPMIWNSFRDIARLLVKIIFAGYLLWGIYFLIHRRPWLSFRNHQEVLALLFWVTIILRLGMASRVYGSTSDMLFWLSASEMARQHLDIYSLVMPFHMYFDKSPFLLWLCWLARKVSDLSGYAFPLVFRWPLLVADIGLVGIIVKATEKSNPDPIHAWKNGLLYTLNPITLGVFLHGQVDALAVAGLLGAWYVLEFSPDWRRKVIWAGSLLALGTLTKTYVIAILPFMLLYLKTIKKQLLCLVSMLSVLLIPFIFNGHPAAALQGILAYRGGSPGTWGLSLIPGFMQVMNKVAMKLHWALTLHADLWLAVFNYKVGIFTASQWLLILGGLGILIWAGNRIPLLRAWLMICLTFFTLGQNIAPQYWLWPVAAVILLSRIEKRYLKWLKYYSLLGGLNYLLGLLMERNLLYPLLGFRLDVPWSAAWAINLGLNAPLCALCAGWWFWELRHR